MIDLVHNQTTGFALVHDEAALSGMRRFMLGRDGECRLVQATGRIRRMPRRVPEDLRALLRTISTCPVIRMIGMRPVSTENVAVFSA